MLTWPGWPVTARSRCSRCGGLPLAQILATSLTARWRYATNRRVKSWDEAYEQIRQVLLERFATLHSLALQQTLWEMGSAVLRARDDIAEIRLSAPNRHHFLADLAPFGLDAKDPRFWDGGLSVISGMIDELEAMG